MLFFFICYFVDGIGFRQNSKYIMHFIYHYTVHTAYTKLYFAFFYTLYRQAIRLMEIMLFSDIEVVFLLTYQSTQIKIYLTLHVFA